MTHRQRSAPAWQPTALGLVVMSLLAVCLAACGTGTSAAPTASTNAVLAAPTQAPTFRQVEQAIMQLYQHQPSIASFQVQAVTYKPKTRDKVLNVCREGSIAQSARELETQRVMACAPLIYFLDRYGVEKSVPEAIAVARQLYQYATAHNRQPYNATKVLTVLLQSWGVH